MYYFIVSICSKLKAFDFFGSENDTYHYDIFQDQLNHAILSVVGNVPSTARHLWWLR
jgi:hypothetical protein